MNFYVISVLTPLARCDSAWDCIVIKPIIFQSTHLLRGATACGIYLETFDAISIHAPLARCDHGRRWCGGPEAISIHAPLARCDTQGAILINIAPISIHAPLARCDPSAPSARQIPRHFNPRTSCEVRHFLFLLYPQILERFQSTHLLRGATRAQRSEPNSHAISIHAPLARCDYLVRGIRATLSNFNPRTSCEVRQIRRALGEYDGTFQSTHLLRGAT